MNVNNYFRQIKISEFLCSNIHLPAEHHMYALLSMFHLIHSKKIGNIQQLLTEMAQLEILAARFEGDETRYLLVIKECKNGMLLSLEQMQQTIMIASLQEK